MFEAIDKIMLAGLGAMSLTKEKAEQIFAKYSRLAERRKHPAKVLSGGERRLLEISRALVMDPEVLLVDEPSFGLAPLLTENVFASLDTLVKQGVTIMLVEQNVTKTLAVTHRGYVLENGRIELSGKSGDLACDAHVRKVFLGV